MVIRLRKVNMDTRMRRNTIIQLLRRIRCRSLTRDTCILDFPHIIAGLGVDYGVGVGVEEGEALRVFIRTGGQWEFRSRASLY